jgi:bromodomain-containing factor 1
LYAAAGVLIVSSARLAPFFHKKSATPPPASATSNGVPVPSVRATLDMGQWRFCISTIRSLKKQKDSPPFLHPVDPLALGIPHYPSIVRIPMDLSTIERKLTSSNPSKPDSNPENPRYFTADEFIADVRLIVKNCCLFNGADHPISAMAKRMEEVFDKQIKNLPLPAEVRLWRCVTVFFVFDHSFHFFSRSLLSSRKWLRPLHFLHLPL